MATITSYYEFEKENNSYKAEIKMYNFQIYCSLEPQFDDKEKRVRFVVNFAPNPLFEKLGSKFERELKKSLVGGVSQCYKKYIEDREKERNLENLIGDLKIKCSEKSEELDCIYSDMLLRVPNRVKEAIEKISSE